MFADDLILYVENPKDPTKNCLDLINEFCKVAEFKVNTKSVAFLYTMIWKGSYTITSLTVALKRIKYLGINLIKEVKICAMKTTKHCSKKLKNKWKHILCSWMGRLNIVKISVLPKVMYRFNAMPIKIPMIFLQK